MIRCLWVDRRLILPGSPPGTEFVSYTEAWFDRKKEDGGKASVVDLMNRSSKGQRECDGRWLTVDDGEGYKT